MSRKLMIGGGILAVLVIVVVVGVTVLLGNLGDIVKAVVEDVGSDTAGVSVTLNNADIDITSGKGTLSGLTVGNPSGFKTDYAFSLGAISVAVDTGTVTSDTIVIKEIRVTKPSVIYELGDKSSNIDTIQANVEKKTGGSGGQQESASSGEEGPKLIIENVYVTDGDVNVSAGFLGGKKVGSSLPNIHLKDIGKEKGGASPAEVAQKIIDAITKSAEKSVAGIDISKFTGDLDKAALDALGSLKSGAAAGDAGKAIDSIMSGGGKAAGDAVKGATDAVDDAGKSLKKLFNN